MATPDEIKKWLSDGPDYHVHRGEVCLSYTQFTDLRWKLQDTLAYIQQLERERNVLINALRHGIVCEVCKHFGKKMNEEPCGWCGGTHSSFEWRGVEDERHET